MLSDEKYENYAKILKKAMDGWGTDDSAIVDLLIKTSNADRQKIKTFYKSSFGQDLLEDLKDELGGDLKSVVVAMFKTPTEYDVSELRKACEGAGTNEDVLIEIIATRSNEELTKIKEMYKKLYGEELEARIIEECGGDMSRFLVSLLQCNRSDSTDIDEDKLNKDLADLYEAGEGSWGTDESTFNKIFANRSPAELRYIAKAYYEATGKTLKEVVASEFSGDMEKVLTTCLHSILSTPDYFATRIYNACKGMGTDDATLIRCIVSRDEIDLKEIKAAFAQKYGKTLKSEIEDECGGEYKKLLVGIVSTD